MTKYAFDYTKKKNYKYKISYSAWYYEVSKNLYNTQYN